MTRSAVEESDPPVASATTEGSLSCHELLRSSLAPSLCPLLQASCLQRERPPGAPGSRGVVVLTCQGCGGLDAPLSAHWCSSPNIDTRTTPRRVVGPGGLSVDAR